MVVIIALLTASIITGTLAVFAYQRRRQIGAKEFSALMITMTLYSFGYAFEFSCDTLSQVLFWDKIEYLGIAFIPVFWFMLVSCYIGLSNRLKSSYFISC